jgi:hypothetical protein
MNQINIYNLDEVVKIEIKDKIVCNELYYRNTTKNWWGKIKPAGFYYRDLLDEEHGPFTQEELRRGDFEDIEILVENNIPYFLPKVKFYFTNGKTEVKRFNTFEEAKSWGTEMSSKSMKNQLID